MRVSLQAAFVLHRRPYRDTSLLLEILTEEYGRMGLLARGARTARSRLKGILQPFRPLLLSWSGRGELPTLTAAEEAGPPLIIPPSRLLSGFYVNELLVRLLPRQDAAPPLFLCYSQLLAALATTPDQEKALRVFEKHLLSELGYGLQLDTDALSGAPIVAEDNYRYVIEQGPVRAEQSTAGVAVSGKSLLALQQETLDDPAALREIKRLIRAALDVYLQGRPLKTRELAAGYKRHET